MNFEPRSTGCANNILRAAYAVLLRKYDGSTNTTHTALIKHFVRNKIEFVYLKAWSDKPGATNPVAHLVTTIPDDAERSRLIAVLKEHTDALEASKISKRGRSRKKLNSAETITNDELVRLTHGLVLYGGVVSSVYENCVYGLRLAHNLRWLRNRKHLFNRYFANVDALGDLLLAVRNWTPAMFTAEQLIQYATQSGVDVNTHFATVLTRLWNIDAAEMADNEAMQQIRSLSDDSLLEAFLSPAQLKLDETFCKA